MEKITYEMIISALFELGFDKIDPILFNYTLAKLSLEDKEHQFVYVECPTGVGFNDYVDFSGPVVKIKEGFTLDTNVSPNNSIVIPVRKTLFSSKLLVAFLETLDFDEIVSKKAEAYGVTSPDKAPVELFSEKEINILRTLQNGQPGEGRKLVNCMRASEN